MRCSWKTFLRHPVLRQQSCTWLDRFPPPLRLLRGSIASFFETPGFCGGRFLGRGLALQYVDPVKPVKANSPRNYKKNRSASSRSGHTHLDAKVTCAVALF